MLRRVEPHSHDLLRRRIIPPAPGKILADGISTRATLVSNCREPRHEVTAAWRVRKVVTCKISVDLECRHTIEFRRRSERPDPRSSSCKCDETCHCSYLDIERSIAPNAGGARLLGREKASGPGGGTRTRGSRGGETDGQTRNRQFLSQPMVGNRGQPGQRRATWLVEGVKHGGRTVPAAVRRLYIDVDSPQ